MFQHVRIVSRCNNCVIRYTLYVISQNNMQCYYTSSIEQTATNFPSKHSIVDRTVRYGLTTMGRGHGWYGVGGRGGSGCVGTRNQIEIGGGKVEIDWKRVGVECGGMCKIIRFCFLWWMKSCRYGTGIRLRKGKNKPPQVLISSWDGHTRSLLTIAGMAEGRQEVEWDNPYRLCF